LCNEQKHPASAKYSCIRCGQAEFGVCTFDEKEKDKVERREKEKQKKNSRGRRDKLAHEGTFNARGISGIQPGN